MDLKKLTIIVCSVWLCIISFSVIKNEIILNTGREVLLKTLPVDPRDILMGDYVILNYEIAQVRPYKLKGGVKTGKYVYVTLTTDRNNVAEIKDMSYDKPSKPYIKGKIGGCDTTIPLYKNGSCIKYGIESYYVKEDTGHEWERKLRDGMLVRVVIDRYGNAKIKGFKKIKE